MIQTFQVTLENQKEKYFTSEEIRKVICKLIADLDKEAQNYGPAIAGYRVNVNEIQ